MSRLQSVQALLFRSQNPGALAEFYTALLGLDFERTEEGLVADVPGLRVAIHKAPTGRAARPRVAFVLAIDDVVAALEVIAPTHAALIREAYETDEGRFAYLFDPDGNELSLFSANPT